MENLIDYLHKIMLSNLGSNISPKTTNHAVKALAVIDGVRTQFLKDTIFYDKNYHSV